MKTRSKNIIAKLAAVVAGCTISLVSQASPYASSVINSGGTVSFILNESADNVKVIYGSTTNILGPLAAGVHSAGPGVTDPVKIEVTKNSGPGWKTPSGSNFVHTVGTNSVTTPWAGRIWISDSNNVLTRYPTPRGLTVNRDPASPFFGRVYVANSSPGTTAGRSVGRGLYTMNADLSDSPNGFGDNAQQTTPFSLSGASGPWHISAGTDGNIYIADFSDANGNVFRVDGNLQNIEQVFTNSGGPATILPPTNHGSIKRVRTTGSLAGGNLKVYTMDEDYTNSIPTILSAARGSIFRYDINSGPLTNDSRPVLVSTPSPSWVNTGTVDFDVGTNGYIYVVQNRAVPNLDPGLYVIDAATGVNITNTRSIWREISGVSTNYDLLANVGYVSLSPDNKYLAIGLVGAANPGLSDTWIIPLVNGIPDLANRMVLDSGQVNQNRAVDFDAAGNLYTVSSGDTQLRVWSPGGSTTITTGNDGSFNISTPPTTVTITALVTNANEQGPVNAAFTVTRSGGLATALTVNYTMGGTATSGSDYTALSGAVTFLPGASSTNVTVAVINDPDTEFSETVVMNLATGAGYGIGSPASATATILDNEQAQISISGDIADGAQTNLLESFVDSKAVFKLTRKGLLSAPTTVALSYSGVAGQGSDYSGPASVTFLANAVSTNVVLTSINDSLVEAPESFTVTVAAGSYSPGTPISAVGLVYSEDLALATSLFEDQFNTDTSAGWIVNQSADLDSDAVFGFDYSSVGIPEAPSSTGVFTATRGLRLRAHVGLTAITPGISVSPLGASFTGDYQFRFDAWINYVGPLDVGGAGSTEHASYGIGTAGNVPIWPGGGSSDCVWFTTDTDGDVGESSLNQADFGVFIGPGLQSALTGYYNAGTDVTNRGGTDPYYGAFGGSVAPAAQTNLYPIQTATVRKGAMGMAWHSVVLTKSGDEVTWNIDGYRIATVTNVAANITLGDNVFLGFHDWFSSTNADPTLTFALYDNVRVESLVAPIVITGIQIITGGTQVQVNFTASSSAVAGDFQLHKSGLVAGTYVNDVGAVITGSAGSFQAVTAVSPGQQFYRIKKP